jgi:hypothetical protein
VLDSKDITGSIVVAAANVTIRRSSLHANAGEDFGIKVVGTGSVTIEDTTITGYRFGVTGDNYTAIRVEVTGLKEDGFILGSHVTVDSSWCHDFVPESGAHSDCAQLQSGETNVIVRDSWFDPGSGGNSAIFIAPDLGPDSNGPVSISGNVFGGGNFSLYCVDGANGKYHIRNILVVNNKFIRNATYGPADVNVAVTWEGNGWADSGALIPVGG